VIAEIVGDDWSERALRAAVSLSEAGTPQLAFGERLLAGIRQAVV